MKTRAHLIIKGHVQGVWFRASTKQQAERHGLVGWVKNTRDGAVEAVVEGEKQRVDDLIHWCHEGPPLSTVETVHVEYQKFNNEFSSFDII